MKYLTLILLLLLFLGCSNIEYPDEFVKSIRFTSDVIDVEEMQMLSKDELVEFVNETASYIDYYGNLDYIGYRLEIEGVNLKDSESSLIYINPLSNKKLVLDKNIYKLGMPIAFRKNYGNVWRFSEQPVILIKGKPEWADSSYKGFTILPVANSSNENDLDFNWTIKKI